MSNDSTEKLTGGAVTEILARLDVMGKHLLSLESKVDGINSRLETRIDSLETKVDKRLQETRPIWEDVQNRLSELQESLVKVDGRLDKVDTRLDEVITELKVTRRTFKLNYADLVREQDELGERIEALEKKVS